MISLNSPEFYTIAFVVVMALLVMFLGHREKRPPSTYIVPLTTTPDEGESDDVLCMEPQDGGRVLLSRTGLSLGAEETINLVITIQEDHCTIIEKKGLKRRKAVPSPVTGEASLKCLRPGTKYRVRYESQLTSTWASFTLDTASSVPLRVTLKY